MKVSDLGEFGLIEHLKAKFSLAEVGDDTACVELADLKILLTCDTLLEGRHFLPFYPISTVGWKAVSATVSDIIANGGKPLYLLVSLLLPDVELKKVDELYEGMTKACEFYGTKIVGGNVVKAEKLGLDLFAVGQAERFVGRSSAKAGDGVFVSGTLGDSLAGLELLLMERKNYEDFELRLIERHLRPTARIDYLRHISKYANASMDISDGLASDIRHMAKRSGLRFNIFKEKLPLSKELYEFAKKHGKDPYAYALKGGEDYQLLFTHPPERMNPFLDMSQIGYVQEGEGVFVDNKPLEEYGFDHFRS
ncbi:thiamine-phosphate kinase [Thermocrinis sp.]|uniref:thiamine-phosphate kinase n=1 Tax=Thermocrinis sp. TaxID=2024383 RepID=UPI002FDD24C9